MKKILGLLVIGFLLAACGGDGDEEESNVGATSVPTPLFLLRDDTLPPEIGGWVMVEGTLSLTQNEETIVLSADYTRADSPAVAELNLTLYRDIAAAQQFYNDRVAALQADSSITLNHLTTLADDAYTINENQGGIALVDENGVLELSFAGESTHDELDTLGLMQVGVNALQVRTEKPGGGLGSATLAPIEEEPTTTP